MLDDNPVRTEPLMDIIFLEVHLPGCLPELGGFVLLDQDSQTALVRFRFSWPDVMDEVAAEVLAGTRQVLESFFESMAFEDAVSAVLQLSNVVRAANTLRFELSMPFEATANQLASLLLGRREETRRTHRLQPV